MKQQELRVSRLLIAVVVFGLAGCDAARILALFPSQVKSHVIPLEALTKELSTRGHQLTVVSSFPQDKLVANYTDVALPLAPVSKGNSAFETVEVNIVSRFINELSRSREEGTTTCEHCLENPGVQKLIRSNAGDYDLLILDISYECLFGFAHKFNVPVVGITTGDPRRSLENVGNPNALAVSPSAFLGYGRHMSFWERFVNVVATTFADWYRALVVLPSQNVVMRRYFNATSLPYVGDLERTLSLLLINDHVSLGFPRALLPNVIEVGGLHIKTGQILPKDLKKFMDEAKDGVLYFSLGTDKQGNRLPEAKQKAFLEAFSKMKQRVLWKWDEETMPEIPDNVRLEKWLPQIAIFEHSNTKLFITHGGLLGCQEAAYNAVPILGISVFSELRQNLNRVERSGSGLVLEANEITSETLLVAVDNILNQPSFRKNARQMAIRFRDKPKRSLDMAVFWTEYVLRHEGTQHLRPASLDLSWFQLCLLDVLAVLTLGFCLITLALYTVLFAVVCLARRLLRRQARSSQMQHMNKKVV